MKGGVGVAVAGAEEQACAIAAVNAVGHVRGLDGTIIASARNADGSLIDCEDYVATGAPRLGAAGGNTTISVVALNRTFAKVDLHRIARAASGAYARRIGPFATRHDGDIVFAVCPMDAPPGDLMIAEVNATRALEGAIVRAVTEAKGRDGIPGLADGR
mgnify:FL=1